MRDKGLGIDLVVFDLDGTLIDSRRDLADATNALIEEYGGTPLSVEVVTAMVGEGAAVLVRRALRAARLDRVPEDALERFLAHYQERLTVHTRPYPGIPEALAALRERGCSLALLTNKPHTPTIRILELLDLARWFSDVVGGDTAAGRKPDPAGLLQIIEHAQATPATTVLVGDSRIDVQTARRAAVRLCVARYGFGYREGEMGLRGEDVIVENPAQLTEVIR
jgi:phosphoglycolate phosphatase